MLFLQGHTNSVQALVYAPDGATLASAGDDHTIRLWNPVSGAERAVLRGHDDGILCLAYGADSHSLASCGFDRRVLLWDLDRLKFQEIVKFHYPAVSLAFSRDGRFVAAGADYGTNRSTRHLTLRVRDVVESRDEWRNWFRGNWPAVWAVALSPDGQTLAAAAPGNDILLWALPEATERARLRPPAVVNNLAFSPDERTLAALAGPQVILWDLASGQQLRTFGGERYPVWSLSFSADGRTLATGSRDSTVRLWDVHSGAERRRYDWQLGRINAVAIAPDGMTAAASGMGRDIVVWDVDL